VGGRWRVSDSAGRESFQVDGETGVVNVGAKGRAGSLRVVDAAGGQRIQLTGESGDIRLLGADCAEDFTVRNALAIDGGTVLVIDEDGALRASARAYDRRVAGVVSGAGDQAGHHPRCARGGRRTPASVVDGKGVLQG
jgi:hypothetical protein